MEALANDSVVSPANAANTAPVETEKPDGETVKTDGDGSAPSSPEARAPEKVSKDPVQERIDKLTREKYDALREADLNRYKVEQLERMREQAARFEQEDKAEEAKASGPPTLESCGFDEAKYHAATHAYFLNIAREESSKATEQTLRAERERERAAEQQRSWKAREAEFAKSKPDYFEKAYDRSLALTNEMLAAIAESERGPAVVYHLSENREAAAAISRLPPLAQAVEIGRIVERLAKPVAPAAVSQAPPPPPKVESQAAATEKAPEDMIGATPTQFEKWRRKYMAK
jgi:hypothetical protein